MLTYNLSDPGGDRYFPTPFSVLGTGALISKGSTEGPLITSPLLQMRVLRQGI